MSSAEIRPTTPADVDALADVLVQVHAKDGYPVEGIAEPQSWLTLTDPLGQWTASLNGQPVGHVAMTRPGHGDAAASMLEELEGASSATIAVLVRLFVAPAARGASIAEQLMETVETRARTTGLRLTLDVMEKDRQAIALYKRRGWAVLGAFEHRYGAGLRTSALAMVAPSFGPIDRWSEGRS